MPWLAGLFSAPALDGLKEKRRIAGGRDALDKSVAGEPLAVALVADRESDGRINALRHLLAGTPVPVAPRTLTPMGHGHGHLD
jgi:hypothetical protein